MSKRVAAIIALAVLLGGAFAPSAHADGQVTFGTQWWTQDAKEAKYQEFKDVPQGSYLDSFLWRGWSGKNGFSVFGSNALRKDQLSGVTLASGVRWRADYRFQEIPHRFSEIARTPYTEIRPGVLVLPDSLQAKNQRTPGTYIPVMNDLLGAAPHVGLSFRTDISKARLRARPAQGWQLEFRGSRRDRSGTKPYGGTFGFSNAVEVFEPIDQRTLDGEARASYAKNKVTVQASVGASAFKNNVSTLIWDNPKRVTDVSGGDGPSKGQLDLYPDNKAIRGQLGLGIQLPHSSALTGNVSVSRLTQNDPWLPYTVNTAIPESNPDSLPGKSTDAKAVRVTMDYRLTSALTKGFHGTLRFHRHHYDNQTPEHTFSGRAPYDVSWTAGANTNEPLGNTQSTIGLDLDYKLTSRVSLGGTGELRKREHTLREAENDDEPVLGGRARITASDDLSFELGYSHGNRYQKFFDDSAYLSATGAQAEQPGLRRFDLANRLRDEANAGVTCAVGERLDLSVQYVLRQNRYNRSVYGLAYNREYQAASDAVLHASDVIDLSGGFGVNRSNTEQRSATSGAIIVLDHSADWSAGVRDVNTFAYGRADWRVTPKRWTLSAGYTFSRDQAKYHLTNNFSPAAQDLPDTFYRLHEATLEARCRLKGQTDLTGRYQFDEWRITDFASQNVPLLNVAAGSATAIFLGDSSLPYKAHRLALLVSRRF